MRWLRLRPKVGPVVAEAAAGNKLRWRMKSPVHRCRDVEHSRGQGGVGAGTNCLQAEQRIPISKDVITSSSASAMWFIRDACGIMCAVITWLLVFYAEFVVLFVMLLPSKNLTYSIVNGTLFNFLAFLALASHLRAMCTDPVSQTCLVFQANSLAYVLCHADQFSVLSLIQFWLMELHFHKIVCSMFSLCLLVSLWWLMTQITLNILCGHVSC